MAPQGVVEPGTPKVGSVGINVSFEPSGRVKVTTRLRYSGYMPEAGSGSRAKNVGPDGDGQIHALTVAFCPTPIILGATLTKARQSRSGTEAAFADKAITPELTINIETKANKANNLRFEIFIFSSFSFNFVSAFQPTTLF